MPIQVIPNQPIRLGPYLEPRFCQNGRDYCYLHQATDPFRLQFRQTPDGQAPGSCDPIFDESGSELTTNGTFSGSASGWTLTNANYGTSNVCFDGSASAGISQPLALSTSSLYKVIVTVSGMTTGTVNVALGGTGIGTIVADGSYVFYAFPGAFNQVEVGTGDSADACIEDVSVKLFSPCWVYDNTNFIVSFNANTSGSKITHIPG